MKSIQAQTPTVENRRGGWAAIEREILAALSQTELSTDSRRDLCIEAGPTGIVIKGEVRMGWERDLAKVVAQLHNHGLPVFNDVRLYCQSTAPFAEESV